MRLRHLPCLATLLPLIGCLSTSEGGPAASGSGGDGAASTSSSSGTEVKQGSPFDLFACALVPDCVQDIGHLGENLTDETRACGGKLATSGDGGTLLWLMKPYATQDGEHLFVLQPDGTVWSQDRNRWPTEPWVRGHLERCVIQIDPAAVAGCDADGPCSWTGETTDCVEVVVDWSCADVSAP